MKRTENETKRYQTFEDLEAQVAREFRKAMYRIARRLPEEERFALASADENDFPASEIKQLTSEAWRVHKLINGYIRFLRSRTAGDSSRVRESASDYDLAQEDLGDLFLGRLNPSSLQRFNE